MDSEPKARRVRPQDTWNVIFNFFMICCILTYNIFLKKCIESVTFIIFRHQVMSLHLFMWFHYQYIKQSDACNTSPQQIAFLKVLKFRWIAYFGMTFGFWLVFAFATCCLNIYSTLSIHWYHFLSLK